MALVYFNYEASRPRRWSSFVAGLAINVAGVLTLIVVNAHLPNSVSLQTKSADHYITLVAPLLAPSPAPPRHSPVQVAKLKTPRPEPPRIAPPVVARLNPPSLPPVDQPKPKLDHPNPTFPQIAASSTPKPAPAPLKTNVFPAPPEAAALHQPPRQVQTGGFGDPNGIPGQGDPKRQTVTVASLGSFDAPAGAGKGNGTGGTHGVSGTIRAAGFGDGTAPSDSHGRANGGSILKAGFTDASAPGPTSTPHQTQKKPDVEPVQILFKPRPAYTEEARRRRVEGEVLLDVVFSASGALRINRVVKGLGYGLDDSALAAAEHIQFRPARRDGQPYDCAALVHMVFELSE